jgi:hypothetical protein
MRFAKRDGLEKYRYRELDVPLVLMALLSVSYVHAFITRIPVPLLKSERVAMRFVIIPVVLLALLSSIRMEVVLRSLRQTFKLRFLAISTMALAALSFVDHSYLWSIARLDRIFTSKAVDLTVPPIQDLADGLYKTTFGVSVGISLAALAVSIYAMTKWRRIERQA